MRYAKKRSEINCNYFCTVNVILEEANGTKLFRHLEYTIRTTEPQYQKMYLLTCAHSEDTDQPVNSHSVVRILIGRIDANFLHADDEDFGVQADLSLRRAHMSEGTFSHVVAQLFCFFAQCSL